MQRLHCWFDQLTLRRSRRRESKRESTTRRGASVAANCRLAEERKLKPIPIPTVYPKPRQGIRTNPWLYTSYPPGKTNNQLNIYDDLGHSLDRRRPPTLGVTRLDESTCSSGYGSQDCSPDSSIHQPVWQQNSWSKKKPVRESWNDEYGSFLEEPDSFYDNICDEHVYHELEVDFGRMGMLSRIQAICRRPERSYSSDCISCDSPQPRPDSPIYAQPWSNHWTQPQPIPGHQPLVVRNQSFQATVSAPRRVLPARPASPIYATPYCKPEPAVSYPNSFVSRLEKVHKRSDSWEAHTPHPAPETFEAAEQEFLEELDAQINELQQRSDELRMLVERARQRRQTVWNRPMLECTFELDL